MRGRYNDLIASLTIYFTRIARMPPPPSMKSGKRLDAFERVRKQILLELEYAVSTQHLFDRLDALALDIKAINTDQLLAVLELLSIPPQSKEQTDPRLFKMLDIVVGGLVKAYGGPAGLYVAIAISGLRLALTESQGEQPLDHNYKLTVAQLFDALDQIYLGAKSANASFEFAILQDWDRLNAVGSRIRSGVWRWPRGTTVDVAKKTQGAHRKFFLATLTGLRWQRTHYHKWTVVTDSPNWPEEKLSEVAKGHRLIDCQRYPPETGVMAICEVKFSNKLGKDARDLNNLGPFTPAPLMDEIIKLGSIREFLNGEGVWAAVPIYEENKEALEAVSNAASMATDAD